MARVPEGTAGFAVVAGQPDDWTRPRYRVRDLDGRDRLFAIAMLVLVLVPFAVALVRAFRDGWIPSGDEANIAIRALNVFSRHPPLTGLPSTSLLYGDKIATNHPGPIEFYLLAVPLRVLGMSVGPILTAATINASCVLITLWVFLRRLGLNSMLWAGVLLLAVMWSGGTAVLTDTLSSNMTMYSLLCTAVLAWALVDGDLRLLPLAAFVASYAAQQHLAAGIVVGVLIAVALGALAVQIVIRARNGDATITRSARRWSAIALAVSAVCWVPVAINEFTGHPGNLTAIVRFARDDTRPTLGLEAGLYQAVHALTPPTVLGRTDTTGRFFLGAPGTLRMIIAVVVIAALFAITWAARRRSPALARLGLVVVVLLAAGIINGANIPKSSEEIRVNLYRWTWALTFLTLSALGLGVAYLGHRFVINRSSARAATRLVAPALLLVAALIAASVVIVGGADDHNREVPDFSAEKLIVSEILAHINRNRPVLVSPDGHDAVLSIAPYVVFRLEQAGMHVEVNAFGTSTAGLGLPYRPSAHLATVAISSGRAEQAFGPGELIALQPFGPGRTAEYEQLADARTALLDDLAAEARGVKVELAPGARARIDREYSALSRLNIETQLGNLTTDPLVAFNNAQFVDLLRSRILVSPVLDYSNLQKLVDLPRYSHRGTYGDEQVQVHLISPP